MIALYHALLPRPLLLPLSFHITNVVPHTSTLSGIGRGRGDETKLNVN